MIGQEDSRVICADLEYNVSYRGRKKETWWEWQPRFNKIMSLKLIEGRSASRRAKVSVNDKAAVAKAYMKNNRHPALPRFHLITAFLISLAKMRNTCSKRANLKARGRTRR
jgi:hypothetical protein